MSELVAIAGIRNERGTVTSDVAATTHEAGPHDRTLTDIFVEGTAKISATIIDTTWSRVKYVFGPSGLHAGEYAGAAVLGAMGCGATWDDLDEKDDNAKCISLPTITVESPRSVKDTESGAPVLRPQVENYLKKIL